MPAGFDLADAQRDGAPSHRRAVKEPTRRETILNLVEMLLQQNEGNEKGTKDYEDEKDESDIDEQQSMGAESFNKFQKRVNNLDKELRSFANAARQLGSSAAILSSAFDLRKRLAHLLYLYRENAADLFPKRVKPSPVPVVPVDPEGKYHRKKLKKLPKLKLHAHFSRPTLSDNLDLEDFPTQFDLLAKDVTTFANCLNEFPEFNDEAVDASIHSFETDLKYWASCLSEYSGQFRYPAVQRYLHDLTFEMGEHMDNITSSLSMFVEVGVPIIRFAQKHGATNLLNLTTVATFFSAVTATTIQFSYEFNGSKVAIAVNSFWFASLVFSIASAVNSLLGLTWKQAMYRSPGHRVPWWVLIWIKRSPLVLLVMSVACFSIGLCCFAYATEQNHVTSTLTTVFTAFTSLGLCSVSLWFISERWTYLRHSGKKWLSDVLSDFKDQLFNMPGMSSTRSGFHWARLRLRAGRMRIGKLSARLASTLSRRASDKEKQNDVKETVLPVANSVERISIGTSRLPRISDVSAGTTTLTAPSPVPRDTSSPTSFTSEATLQGISHGKLLWKNAIRTVRMRSAVSAALATNTPRSPHRQRTTSSSLVGNDKRNATNEGPLTVRSRLRSLTPKLQSLESTQEIHAHQALVRHMQFSPDGKFLATSSWDRTSVIFRVGEPFESHRILAHTRGRVSQVAWSPAGGLLLTKLLRAIKIWSEDGVCQKTISRTCDVETIAWFPGGEALLSVEGSDVVKMDTMGRPLDSYNFGRIKLHDVAVTPDRMRILGVGPLLESPNGLQPSKCRAEKRLIVFNMETKQIESQIPLVNDVRDVTLSSKSKHGLFALVSYENQAPPQLWRIDMVKSTSIGSLNQTVARPTLKKTYFPKVTVDFAGSSYFGGKDDELILCAGKAGDIHIWDRNSGEVLHHIRAQASGGDLTSIAWNPAVDDPYMFATGSHDGVVRIWTKPPPDFRFRDSIVRTSSPDFDPDMQRTDSPQEFESTVSSLNGDYSDQIDERRDRIVVFADDLTTSVAGAGVSS